MVYVKKLTKNTFYRTTHPRPESRFYEKYGDGVLTGLKCT